MHSPTGRPKPCTNNTKERPWRPDRPARPQQRPRSARRRADARDRGEHTAPAGRASTSRSCPGPQRGAGLALSIRRLHHYLTELMPFTWRIVIADNASTDATRRSRSADRGARRRQRAAPRAEGSRAGAAGGLVAQPARVVATWTSTSRPICARCCRWSRRCSPATARWRSARGWPRLAGHARRASASSSRAPTTSCCARLRAKLQRRPVRLQGRARRRAPERSGAVRDQGWFFDTELLIAAQRRGMRIHEVAVDWVDDPDSRVDIVAHRARGPARVARRLVGQDARWRAFMAIGAALDTRLRAAVPRARWAARLAPAAKRRRADAHRRGQHRRQPALHLRRARARAAAAAPRRRPDRLRARAGADRAARSGAAAPARPAARGCSRSACWCSRASARRSRATSACRTWVCSRPPAALHAASTIRLSRLKEARWPPPRSRDARRRPRSRRPSRLRSLVRGHAEDPAWARPLLIALLAVTLIAYLWT